MTPTPETVAVDSTRYGVSASRTSSTAVGYEPARGATEAHVGRAYPRVGVAGAPRSAAPGRRHPGEHG